MTLPAIGQITAMMSDLPGADHAGLEQVELSPAIHLSLHELEFCDLLSVVTADRRLDAAHRLSISTIPQ